VRATVLAMTRSMLAAYREPAAAIRHLQAREALTDVAIEGDRLQVAFREMLVTDSVRRNGLSHVDPARMARQVDAVRDLQPAEHAERRTGLR
jgi:NitT/TauT family transport system substrate-binding protein